MEERSGEKANGKKIRSTAATSVTLEVKKEETLPDYQGEIMKVLLDRADVSVGECYLAGKDAVVEGVVRYRVFFRNREGKLGVSTFDAPFEYTAAAPEGASAFSAVANLLSSSVRSTGPKKLSAKTTLSLLLFFGDEKSFSPEIAGNGVVETKTEPHVFFSVGEARANDREYNEELARLPDVPADDVEVITSGGTVVIDTQTPKENGVLIGGNILLNALIRVGEEPPYAIGKTMPFEEFIPYPDGQTDGRELYGDAEDPSCECFGAYGTVDSCKVKVLPALEGESDTVAAAEATVSYRAFVMSENKADLTVDCFSVGGSYQTESEKATGERLACRETQKTEAVAEVIRASIPDGEKNLREPIIACVTVENQTVKQEENGWAVSANIRFNSLFTVLDEEGKTLYVPIEASTKIKRKVNNNCQICKDTRVFVTISPAEACVTFDEEKIRFSSDLTITLLALTPFSAECFTRVETVAGEDESGEICYRVFYPSKDDSLWTVCKRYARPLSLIAAVNRLTEEQFANASSPASLRGVDRMKIV